MAVEGCLNFLGFYTLGCWEEIEKRLSTPGKLALLGEVLEMEIDMSQSPFGHFKELFKFRNRIAHSRVERVDHIREEVHGDLVPITRFTARRAEWEEWATLEKTSRLVAAGKEMIKVLCSDPKVSGLSIDGHTIHRWVWDPPKQ
jgi:hypothetical protein